MITSGRKRKRRTGWSFNDLNSGLFYFIFYLEHKRQNIYIFTGETGVYYITILFSLHFCIFERVDISKGITLEAIKPSPPTSAGISSCLWPLRLSPNLLILQVDFVLTLKQNMLLSQLLFHEPGSTHQDKNDSTVFLAEITHMVALLQRSRTLSLTWNLLKYVLYG